MIEKKFDLEERTTEFAKAVIKLCKTLPRDCINIRLISQVVGASGSIGANYREANDALGKKDFIHRIKISRRESKEAWHWLELLSEANHPNKENIRILQKEVLEFKNIFSSIITKFQQKELSKLPLGS